jgi:hypothetical protein
MVTQYKHVKNTVYSLKRRYGQQVTLNRQSVAGTYDYTTGAATGRTLASLVVKRAILLPARGSRTFNYDLSFIAANKNFTYGGFYDKFQRRLILDQKDITGGFTVDLNTTVTIGTKEYETKEVQEYEEQSAILLILVETKGHR